MAEGGRRKIPSWFQPASLAPSPPPESVAAGDLSVEVADEEKIDKFYKLIGNMKAERELWQSNFLNGRKRQRFEREIWKPAFEWEDFAGESHGGSSAAKNGEDGRKRSRKEREEKGGDRERIVDLNLGL